MKSLLRKVRLKIGKFFLDKKIEDYPFPLNPKIIILQQDGKIGDYIVSSFIFRELKKHNPNMIVDVVCSPNNANLFAQNSYIDHYFILDRKQSCAYTNMGLKLAKKNYDILINLPVLLRNQDLWLTRLINAKNNIGYQKQNYKIFNLSINDSNLHFSQIYAKAIELCSVNNINLGYDMPFYSNKIQDIAQFIQHNKLDGCIAINFFGAASSRKFTNENILKFLEYFVQVDKKFLLLTYSQVTSLLKDLSKDYKNVFIYDKTESIFDSIELLNYCNVVISPDTSIIHIAAGLNKKIIGFYKLNDQENFMHWHPNTRNETHIISFTDNVNEILPDEIKKEWLE